MVLCLRFTKLYEVVRQKQNIMYAALMYKLKILFRIYVTKYLIFGPDILNKISVFAVGSWATKLQAMIPLLHLVSLKQTNKQQKTLHTNRDIILFYFKQCKTASSPFSNGSSGLLCSLLYQHRIILHSYHHSLNIHIKYLHLYFIILFKHVINHNKRFPFFTGDVPTSRKKQPSLLARNTKTKEKQIIMIAILTSFLFIFQS